ncbi:ATP-grasp domain-containing protein [Streptomyces sp. T21Q-yed]|nr:ATP-grasp domain-containing protein [Streptomyces sp. T21Q-yed]MDF3139922.1 ATP-grasp domain-containing protein [Streptomyces sp. T21Q-yed]
MSDAALAESFGQHGESVAVDPDTPWGPFLLEQATDWKPDGILAFSELVAADCHAAASKTGLPGAPVHAAERLRSKHSQRTLMAAAGIPMPAFRCVGTLEELREAAEHVGLPAVLKPVVGVGSAATYPVDQATDLATLWRTAERAYLPDPRGSGQMSFILEARLFGQNQHGDERFGDQVSVESVVCDGRVHHLTVTDKLPLEREFRETGDISPSSLPAPLQEELREISTAAIRALDLDNTAVHTEFKLTPDGPRVIEVNGRIGGGVTELLHYSADYDVVADLAAVAVGRASLAAPRHRRHAAFLTPQPPHTATHVARAPEAAHLLSLPGVVSADVLCQAGSPTDWRRGTSANLARVFAVAETIDDLLATHEALNSDDCFAFVHERSARESR